MADKSSPAAGGAPTPPPAPIPNFTVYNLPPSPPHFDGIGIAYVTCCAIWSALVLGGMIFCWINRNNPVLRIRGLPLSFMAMFFLHAYWILAQIVYPIGKTMNLVLAYDIQYFFMGIWFPLGIALFHASNLRFLHVAKLQKQFAHPSLRVKAKGCNGAHTSWLCKLRNMEYNKKVMLFIGIGMVAQVLLTVGMWLACMKYHPTYGIPGTGMKSTGLIDQLNELGEGWEWWPTLLWQFTWTWIVAPYLIVKSWHMHDTVGWRVQTIGCCLASLHATPMFLIASYNHVFQTKVNMYFAPSEWLHLSTMIFEILTIFLPAYQVIRSWVLNKRSQDINAKWETSSQTSTLRTSTVIENVDKWKSTSINLAEKGQTIDFNDEELGDRLLTMGALEHVLSENPQPLQEFSALRDFSGENIAFLTRFAQWRALYPEITTEKQKREAYNGALELYVDFISPVDAEFPLNISSPELRRMQDLFERAARLVHGESRVNPATPFDFYDPFRAPSSSGSSKPDACETEDTRQTQTVYNGEIPLAFSASVFDSVQSHIKFLVLTNTWPKFVQEMQNRRRSSETGRSDFTATSERTFVSRVSDFIQTLVEKK